MARVDVLIPCYRYGHLLEACVDSALTQSGVDLRVLIVDDASPDDTPQVGAALTAKDRRVTYTRHSSNRGHIDTYNEALDWATGDYLLLLSADDYLTPGALARSSVLMEAHPEVGFAFGNATTLWSDGAMDDVFPLGKSSGGHRVLSGREFIRICGATNLVPTPTALVRTSMQKTAGGYLRELPHSGDLEMWLRLSAQASVGFVNAVQGVYRRHDANMSQGYDGDYGLPDLRQRRAALDAFFNGNARYLAGNPDLRPFLLRDLSRTAIRRASVAFNDLEIEGMKKIIRFAEEASPYVWRSIPWAKLAVKRAMGPQSWRRFFSPRQTGV